MGIPYWFSVIAIVVQLVGLFGMKWHYNLYQLWYYDMFRNICIIWNIQDHTTTTQPEAVGEAS